MALQSSSIKALADAASNVDVGLLRTAFTAITNSQSTQRPGLETLVICAETALKVLGEHAACTGEILEDRMAFHAMVQADFFMRMPAAQ